jgi:hypothetical protein
LFLFLDIVKIKLASRFLEVEDYFIGYSMPVEIWKFACHNRITICKNTLKLRHRKDFVLHGTLAEDISLNQIN